MNRLKGGIRIPNELATYQYIVSVGGHLRKISGQVFVLCFTIGDLALACQ